MLKLKFVNENDEKNPDYICSICKEFLYPDETMQLSCCHMYCSECIETLNSSSLYSSVECPLCMKKSNPQNIKTSNRFAYNILSSIEVYCPYEECNTKITSGSIKNHLKECDFTKISCNYCNCKDIFKKDYKKHLTENMEDHFLKLVQDMEDLKKKIF